LRTIADRLKQRFVLPLALDRVCALLGPAYDQARTLTADSPPATGGLREGEALELLEGALQPYLDVPTGSGLDVPPWLRRLQAELHRVEVQRTAGSNLAENLLQVPRRPMPIEDFRAQLEDWPV
jgi:hypothetical protein